jgi:hypothetical protein
LLTRRWFPYSVCEQRREFLRAMHWWPQQGRAVVVHGGAVDITRADAVASAIPATNDVVVLEAEPGDREFAGAVASRLGARALRLPADRSGLEDRIAAIAGAPLVVHGGARSAVGAIAQAYFRPFQSIDELLRGEAPHESPCTSDAEAQLDAAFDRLAALDGGVPRPVTADAEVAALRVALDAHARRSAHERVVLADYVRAVRAITTDQVRDLEAALRRRFTSRIANRMRRGRGPT